jgi:amidase
MTAVHPDCAAATMQAAQLLESMGHQVSESHPQALDEMHAMAEAFNATWAVSSVMGLEYLSEQLGRPITQDDIEPTNWGLSSQGKSISAIDYAKAQAAMGAFRRSVLTWWEDGFDLLLTPTTAVPPPKIGELTASEDDPVRASRRSLPYAVFTSPFNTTGQPAISLPTGQSDGLPVGVQIVGAYGREDLLIAVGAQLEEAVNWSARRAAIHA